MDYKEIALKLARSLQAADTERTCSFCEKNEWGVDKHQPSCPLHLANEIVNPPPEPEETLFPHLSDVEIRLMAEEKWEDDGELEIDADAVVSRSEDGGAYVAAWVWVGIDDGDDDDDFDDDEEEN